MDDGSIQISIFLTFIGALVYRLFPSVTNILVKIIHFLFQLCSLSFAAVGLTAVIQFHNEYGIANFYSVHSWCGLVICILFSLQVIVNSVQIRMHNFSPVRNPWKSCLYWLVKEWSGILEYGLRRLKLYPK